jgi:hypothetical protein
VDFYELFWGVPLPREHKDSIHDPNDEENNNRNGGENDGDLLPASPRPIIDSRWRQLLIRAEYVRIYNWVEQLYEKSASFPPPAIIVTGQPGIGQYSIINMINLFFLTLVHRKIILGLLHPASTSWGEVCYSVVSTIRVLSLLFRRGSRCPWHIPLQQISSANMDYH